MIAILGDWHLSSRKTYHRDIAEATLEWFASWHYNKSGNILIHVGDLVDSAVNGGLVIEFVERFANTSKFDHIYIVVGNHDVKRRDGIPQLAYSFLERRPDVTLVASPREYDIDGVRTLLMPHFIPGPGQESMKDFYSSIADHFPGPFDLAVGHFNDDTVGALSGTGAIANLHRLNTTHLCLGHIHKRVHPERYIGSMFATRVNEVDSSRAAWLIDTNTKTKTEELLPVFVEYSTVEYPNPLPAPTGIVPVYTISNCPSEEVARQTYGDINIRKIVHPLEQSEMTSSISEIDVYSMSLPELFREFTRENTIDRLVARLCLSLL